VGRLFRDAVEGLSLEDELELGRRQWTVAWRRFARQWTQPQLLKLADAIMGGRYLHSSQISGFATGKLREPAPKVFMVIGRLNQALACGRVPVALQDLAANKKFIADKDGLALDAVGCFLAFTGSLDLGVGDDRSIPEEQVEEANRRLGKFVRAQLTDAGVDFIEELPNLMAENGAVVKSVLLGIPMAADELTESLPSIAAMLQTKGIEITNESLWDATGCDIKQ
jgi:hypothetical protein